VWTGGNRPRAWHPSHLAVTRGGGPGGTGRTCWDQGGMIQATRRCLLHLCAPRDPQPGRRIREGRFSMRSRRAIAIVFPTSSTPSCITTRAAVRCFIRLLSLCFPAETKRHIVRSAGQAGNPGKPWGYAQARDISSPTEFPRLIRDGTPSSPEFRRRRSNSVSLFPPRSRRDAIAEATTAGA